MRKFGESGVLEIRRSEGVMLGSRIGRLVKRRIEKSLLNLVVLVLVF